MKNALDGAGRKHPSALRGGRTGVSDPMVPGSALQRTQAELACVANALTASRREAQAAWAYIQTLTEVNAQLHSELVEAARREVQIRDFAYHDALTGLPNRRLLLDRLRQAVAQAARQHKQVVLLLLDLDGFKSVNDRLGHAGGDRLLQIVARRLTDAIRGADTACRYGGDEFLVMLPEVDGPSTAAAVWGKLTLALSEPYIVDGYQIRMSASMGVVVYPTDGLAEEELIRLADCALYRAKARSGDALIDALPGEARMNADTEYPAAFQQPERSYTGNAADQAESSATST